MAHIQLNFSLRTAASCKTVHLVGNWDGYEGQFPLSKDHSKVGAWKGQFRFTGSSLKQGQRYWYYYIIDGYHVSHDPARDHVVEPTTGRKLNTLDIPAAKTVTAAAPPSSRHLRHTSQGNIPKGRALSPSRIMHPKPVKPHETHSIRSMAFARATVEQLTAKFAHHKVADEDDSEEYNSGDDSDNESDVPSLSSSSSRSSNSSSPSSVVSSSSSCCTCERYGITRAGSRVKLDCGGSRCGYSDQSDCSSESEAEYVSRTTRRQGVVVSQVKPSCTASPCQTSR